MERMKVIDTDLPGVVLVEPKVFADPRGFFAETWNHARYEEVGLPGTMVQDNLSSSSRGVLRGLHFQFPHPQGKLVYVLEGEVLDVAVDIRLGSPTFGRWVGVTLSAANKRQLYIPEGFAHGFCVVSQRALVAYKCTELYRPDCDAGIAWNDPEIGVQWPVTEPILSAKDQASPYLSEIPPHRLPRYVPQQETPEKPQAA
jgi:dTDP-4-dehydrorhamnose 3,5-epimerase